MGSHLGTEKLNHQIMDRRKFVYASLAAGTLPFVAKATNIGQAPEDKALYEIRTYEIKFHSDRNKLENYLWKTLEPALRKAGVTHFMLLGEIGMTDPAKLRVLISYPNAGVYVSCQKLNADPEFLEMATEYNSLPPQEALYNRFGSSLLLAFDGWPSMKDPVENAGLFELRTYEGYSEDAVRRKIKMFNEGEIDIFLDSGFHPVFFGEMIAGPYRPCLTYMLSFKDMEQRDALWARFLANPDWKEISSKDEYAETVSNIRRVFLTPISRT